VNLLNPLFSTRCELPPVDGLFKGAWHELCEAQSKRAISKTFRWQPAASVVGGMDMREWIIIGLVLVLSLAAPLTAQTMHVAEAGSDNGFVTLYSANVERPQKAVKAAEELLRFSFFLENTSQYPVSSVSVAAYVYDESGTLSGYRSLVIDEEIPPGREVYELHMTSAVWTKPGDRIVLRIEEIDGPDGRLWELPTTELEFLEPYAVLPYLELAGSPTYKAGDCVALCTAMATICVSLCGESGVSSFECSQGSDGTCNTSCKCNRPKQV